MPGGWLSRLGKRLLHRETFALMLAPAVADLQFEAPTAGVVRPRHYFGVLKAFAGALCFDLARDVMALGHDLDMIALLTLLQTLYYGFMLVLLSGLGTGKVAALDLHRAEVTHAVYYIVVICVACVVTTSACFWPSRRSPDNDPAV
jgi:hypothetical protein